MSNALAVREENAFELGKVFAESGVTPEEVRRFWSKVERRADNEYWPWTARRYPQGYGQFRLRSLGRCTQAHRVAAAIAHGATTPDKPHVLHSCDNPPCCNPTHLRYGTNSENCADAIDRDRSSRGARNGRAKLTEKDVLAIRAAVDSGARSRALAEQFGVNPSTIQLIARRATWRHV